MSEEKPISVINEGSIMPKDPVTIHIRYTESLTLKELSDVLDLLNKAINDVNRENGIKNNAILGREYTTEVTGVGSGSIIVYILSNLVVPIALSIFGNYIYERLKNIGAKKENKQIKTDNAYPVSISVDGSNNVIELYILKPSNNEMA